MAARLKKVKQACTPTISVTKASYRLYSTTMRSIRPSTTHHPSLNAYKIPKTISYHTLSLTPSAEVKQKLAETTTCHSAPLSVSGLTDAPLTFCFPGFLPLGETGGSCGGISSSSGGSMGSSSQPWAKKMRAGVELLLEIL